MKNKTFFPTYFIQNRWFRLGCALALSCLLALALLLLPLLAETTTPRADTGFNLPFRPGLVYAAGGLTVTKSAPLMTTPGGIITYTLTITNGTDQDFQYSDIFVYDYVPTNTTCLNVEGWGNPACGTPVGWGVPLFGEPFISHTTANLNLIVKVNSPLTETSIVNNAYGAYVGSDHYTGPPVTTTVQSPAWQISKAVSTDTIQPGQQLLYTLTLTNTGPVDSSGVYTVTDYLPNEIRYENLSARPPSATLELNKLYWVIPTPVNAGKSVSFTFLANVTQPLTDGLSIVNQTYYVSGGNVYTAVTAGAPVTVTVDSPADLRLLKIASADPITVGQRLTYTLIVTNAGTAGPALNVVVTDTLSAFTDLITYSVSQGNATAVGGNPIVWQLTTTLPPSQSVRMTMTTMVSTVLPSPALITNTYEAAADNGPRRSGELPVRVNAETLQTVSLTLSPSILNNLCETTVATATAIDKYGNLVAGTALTISKFGGSGMISPNLVTQTNTPGILTATFRGIAVGTMSLIGYKDGIKYSTALLTITQGITLPTSLKLNAVPNSLLSGGRMAVVTGTLLDCLNDAASNRPITFTLNSTSLAVFPGPVGSVSGSTDAAGVLTSTLTSTSTHAVGGVVTITGVSSGPGWNLQDVFSLTITAAPVLTLTKTVNPADGSTVEPGSVITYMLILTNAGGTASGVVLTDSLNANVNFVSGVRPLGGSGPYINGRVITFGLASLDEGESVTASLRVTVTTSVISGTVITNTAAASEQTGYTYLDSNLVYLRIISKTSAPGHQVFLPIILKNQ